MKSSPRALLVLVGLAIACDAPLLPRATSDAADQLDAIKAVFSHYKDAVVANDGVAAAPWVTAGTHAYFGRLRDLALFAQAAKLRERSPIERMHVLVLRQLLEEERLAEMSPREVFAFAVSNRIVGEDLRDYDAIGDVSIERDRAVGRRSAFGRSDDHRIHLVRQDGEWRVDLIPTIEEMNGDLRKLAVSTARSEEALIREIVQLFTEKPLKPEHLRPSARNR
jgi:hypothetical protein